MTLFCRILLVSFIAAARCFAPGWAAGEEATPELTVEEWVAAKKGDIMRGGGGWSLAHLAALDGRVDVLEWLKESGADVNAKDNEGKTPLQLAVSRSRGKMMEWLKANGAE